IHPVLVGPAPRAAKFGLAQIAHYTFDTTLGVGSLLMSGVLDRFPRLKLVLSHGGGAYPYLAGRFDIMHRRMDRVAQGDVAARAPPAYASQILYDSIVHAPKALRFLIDLAGLDNVVLGTDYPSPPADMEPLALLRSAGLSAAEIEAIADANPRRVFTRLRWSMTRGRMARDAKNDGGLGGRLIPRPRGATLGGARGPVSRRARRGGG